MAESTGEQATCTTDGPAYLMRSGGARQLLSVESSILFDDAKLLMGDSQTDHWGQVPTGICDLWEPAPIELIPAKLKMSKSNRTQEMTRPKVMMKGFAADLCEPAGKKTDMTTWPIVKDNFLERPCRQKRAKLEVYIRHVTKLLYKDPYADVYQVQVPTAIWKTEWLQKHAWEAVRSLLKEVGRDPNEASFLHPFYQEGNYHY